MKKPNVYLFNPTCDMAVVNQSVSYMPPERLKLFELDLAPITLWLANSNDWVVTEKTNRLNPLLEEVFINCDIKPPRFATLKELLQSDIPLGQLLPWGWSPEMHHRIKNLKPRCDSSFLALPIINWLPEHKSCFSRNTNTHLINAINEIPIHHPSLAMPAPPQHVFSIEQALQQLKTWHGKAVFKTPWSSSGRGIMMVDTNKGRMVDERWLSGAIKQQNQLIVEPFLDKVADISFHFRWDDNTEPSYLGHNFFITDNKGRFEGCFIEALPPEILSILEIENLPDLLHEASLILKNALIKMELNRYYSGPIGIDALFYKSPQGKVLLHPAIEVNTRHTMGLVNLNIRQKLGEHIKGKWQIKQFAGTGWSDFCHQQQKQQPLTFEGKTLISGFLPLNAYQSTFGAWAIIE